MHSLSTTSCDSWPVGWSAIRESLHLQGGHQFRFLQVRPKPFHSIIAKYILTPSFLGRYHHLSQSEFQIMTEVAKTFLHFLNHWNLEAPSVRYQAMTHEDASTYKINFTRWLVFCHVPAFCNTLRHFETTAVFGRTLLKAVYQVSSEFVALNEVTWVKIIY